jgi:hypothetical protein
MPGGYNIDEAESISGTAEMLREYPVYISALP